MTSWHSYPKVFSLGHAALQELFLDPVLVEEKIDGSQCSAGCFNGELRVRSKGQELIVDAPEKMFARAVSVWRSLALREGWTYRAEYLTLPHHNTLVYSRVPYNNLIIFDINPGEEKYLSYDEKVQEATRIGLEVVPRLFEGRLASADEIRNLLDRDSCLGGSRVEGVVIKNYARFGRDKKALMGKFVSEVFKEVNKTEWAKANPQSRDILQSLVETYRSEARWAKAIQHLREQGLLEGDPRDIGPLIRAAQRDVEVECEEEIKGILWGWAWPHINRKVTAGLPEWYKQRLLESQFTQEKE